MIKYTLRKIALTHKKVFLSLEFRAPRACPTRLQCRCLMRRSWGDTYIYGCAQRIPCKGLNLQNHVVIHRVYFIAQLYKCLQEGLQGPPRPLKTPRQSTHRTDGNLGSISLHHLVCFLLYDCIFLSKGWDIRWGFHSITEASPFPFQMQGN